jgi:hypothetical protein
MQRKAIISAAVISILLMGIFAAGPLNDLEAYVYKGCRCKKSPAELVKIVPGTQKGLYLTGYNTGNIEKRNELYRLISETELNSIVFDVKDDWGNIDYNTDVDFAEEIGAVKNYCGIEVLLEEMKSRRINSIARMVVFKDNVLPKARPDLAIKDSRTGKPLYSEGSYWPDIYSEEVWSYHIELIKELAEKGVEEVQFDYIRAPARGNIHYAEYTHNTEGNSKVWAITSFLKKVREELKDYDIKISADVFGWTFIADNDQGIGQQIEEMAPYLDYIYPMAYPSHYGVNFLGYEIPDAHPYEVVKYTLEKGIPRIDGTECMVVPWVQAFSLNVKYTEVEILEQIRAAEELGINGFLCWNAFNSYYSVEKALVTVDEL